VERDALRRFATTSLGTFTSTRQWYRTEHRIAALGVGRPLSAVAMVVALDGSAHLEGLYVRSRVQGRGIGAALLEAAAVAARASGAPTLTVSTYEEVPFNAPWYRSRGFVDLPNSAYGPELAALVDDERAAGLTIGAPRVILARRLR
jgi:GNAT superfamily N-acetyltransferase